MSTKADCPNWHRGCQCHPKWCDFCGMTHRKHKSRRSDQNGLCPRCGHHCGHMGPLGFTTCEWRANALPLIELGFSLAYFDEQFAS